MKKVNFGTTGLQVPAIAVGCMRLTSLDETGAAKYLEHAVANGVNFFDHADIYGGGQCETLFGKALRMTDISSARRAETAAITLSASLKREGRS